MGSLQLRKDLKAANLREIDVEKDDLG